MSKVNKILWLYSTEMVHAGAQKGTGFIDNPIQREGHTNIPMLRGRGVKSAIRDYAEENNINHIDKLLGNKDNPDTAACIRVSDARLLLMPMPSTRNLFAYITCPYILNRFLRDNKLTKFLDPDPDFNNLDLADTEYFGTDNLTVNTSKNKIILREHVFTKKDFNKNEANKSGDEKVYNDILKKLKDTIIANVGSYWQDKVIKDVVVLSDTAFQELVTIYTHFEEGIKIDANTNTVKDTGLFITEYLPADTLLYSIISAGAEFNSTPIYDKGKASFDAFKTIFPNNATQNIQLGGDYTLYKGEMIAYLQD